MSAILQNAKGPASVSALPSRGSTNPQKDKEMNRSKTIIIDAENPDPSAAALEPICDRVERLAYELSDALSEWNRGTFMGMIYPAGHPMDIHFRNVGATPASRLSLAGTAYKQCAREVDPSATEWWELRTPDETLRQRFVLIGSRPDEVA